MQSVSDTRQTFLDFFKKNGHEVLPSAPLVPKDDPTLMFTNAGMVPFKNIFTGTEKAPSPRAVSSQKCVRAGGKHNDLENVGYTARHHTFFEMLGNFSFGDYFKERAIELAWKLLTEEFKLDKTRLYFTVYHTDDEAFNLWKKITGCEDGRILRVPTNDNFWAMGDTGPCGPCSEIFYDHGQKAGQGEWTLNKDGSDRFGERFVEIWNLVFMQYEQVDENTRRDLPRPSIDTGMGLERMAAVLQGVHDNYHIDLFRQLITDIASETSLVGAKAQTINFLESSVAHRVIADHLRSCSFLIADGVLPSNEGRGYVLRRIMRRAMRYAHQLGCREPLMYRLVPSLVKEMGDAYPELVRAQKVIAENLRMEEERFKQMLERGLKLLDEETVNLKKGSVLSGETAFKLYDTYGFPLDLTQDILRGRGIGVDDKGFDAAMERQKDMARAAWSGSGEKAVEGQWFKVKEETGATEFVGYEQDSCEAVIRYIKDGYVVLDKTPFYGESGGQIGDTGWLKKGTEIVAEVSDTRKPVDDLHVHQIKMLKPLAKGDKIVAEVDAQRRDRIRANHSATHILHAVLRRRLGEHVTQKGSLVAPDRLRFDISHPKAIAREELDNIEQEVNRIIWQNSEACIEVLNPAKAQKKGAMALFGEKYGDKVRVLSMGSDEKNAPYSMELCGGTHVRRTGDIGLFKIISEGAVAAGVRRIEAVTREGAYTYLTAQETMIKELADHLKTPPDKLAERVETLLTERKKLEKELAEAKKALALSGGSGSAPGKESIGNIQFIAKSFAELPPKDLRGIAEDFLKKAGDKGVVAVASGFEGKASIVVAVSQSLTSTISAVELVQIAAAAVGGKGGGGRPDMAQAGGPEGNNIEAALTAARELLHKKSLSDNKL